MATILYLSSLHAYNNNHGIHNQIQICLSFFEIPYFYENLDFAKYLTQFLILYNMLNENVKCIEILHVHQFIYCCSGLHTAYFGVTVVNVMKSRITIITQ